VSFAFLPAIRFNPAEGEAKSNSWQPMATGFQLPEVTLLAKG